MIRKHIGIGIALLAFGLIIGLTHPSSGYLNDAKKKSDKINWKTFDEGIALAKKNNKMLVVDFYTDWCHWCKVMDEQTFASQEVIEYAKKNAVMAKLNAETKEKFKFRDASYSGRELSMMFGVRGFPTTVFINSDGELITSISGFIPPDRFKLIMVYLAEGWYEKMKFDEFIKQEEDKNKS